MSQSQQSAQQSAHAFQSIAAHGDHCLRTVRLLRSEVVDAHRKLSEMITSDEPPDPSGKRQIEDRLIRINHIFENLEGYAFLLPSSVPSNVPMDRLNRLLEDGSLDLHTKQLCERLLRGSTWMEVNSDLLQMFTEFLRALVGGRRRSIMTEKAVSFTNFTPSTSSQRIFEQTLVTVVKDPTLKKIGLTVRYLERSVLNSVVELRYGQNIDRTYVCTMKMLMVVNCGLPEFIQIVAPHEDWTYLSDGSKQVDVLVESRYMVYRKLSVQANLILLQSVIPSINIQNPQNFAYLIGLLYKLSSIFDSKCRICKKILKDFLPPVILDTRTMKAVCHESCRY